MPILLPKAFLLPRSPLAMRVKYSPAHVAELCHHLQFGGLTERHAAWAIGLYPETLRLWKRDHPELAPLLAAARSASANPPSARAAKSASTLSAPRPAGR